MWREVVDMIKRESSPDIVKTLKISFEGLQDKEKTIFLDIACFFRGMRKDEAIEILESYDSGAHIRLRGLIEKSLVFITIYDTIQMHDLIQDMGRYVVKKQKDSGKCSRIWNAEDFEDVIVNSTVTMALEAIWFTNPEEVYLSKDAMINMQRLRILRILRPWGSQSDLKDDSIEYLSNNLCWFVWYGYPWKLLPENFNPRRLVHVDLRWSLLHYLWNETKLQQFMSLRWIDLSESKSLKRTPDFKGMPNLEYLNLRKCTSLEEVHPSLKYCKKLIELNLSFCTKLERFPYVNVESLESVNLSFCCSLERFPEILGIRKQGTAIKIRMSYSRIRELPFSFFDLQPHLTELHLNGMENLVSLPSSICKLKVLVKLNVSNCSKLESLPEEISDLENLGELDASYTLISRPPSSIIRLNKLKWLNFENNKSDDEVNFVFPPVSKGLRSLEYLDLNYCNIIDGGLPEDIGSLSSLRYLLLESNNFEHLPQSISKLGALRYLELLDCKKLTQLPELPQQLDIIDADWSNDRICNSLFQNMLSLQHDIYSSHSLSLRVYGSLEEDIPSWFNYQGRGTSVSVNLPDNWYEPDKFLGFAVCYCGEYSFDCITAHLIPLCDDDGMSSMAQQFALSNHLDESVIIFLLVPLGGLWDASNAYEKTPNDYGCFRLFAPGQIKEYGVRLLYKDEAELGIGIRKCRYEEEATCSSSKKQRSQVD